MLGELNELQIKNVLSSQALGRMACAEGELPYIIPVTYAYDGDFIYGQTNEGKKLDILRKNHKKVFKEANRTRLILSSSTMGLGIIIIIFKHIGKFKKDI